MKTIIYNQIMERFKNGEKTIGIYEKRAGGEIVFLKNIRSHEMICTFDIFENWSLGNARI